MPPPGKPKVILLAGPTASGKSALALDLALRLNGTVINADSMQIYRGLPILTAQPDLSTTVPHKLYGFTDPTEAFSVGKWLPLATEAIRHALKENSLPIVTGGTGLYFRALTEGLADIPPIPSDVRAEGQRLYTELGGEVFREKLRALDPILGEKLRPSDPQRLIRAWEVAIHTGKPLSQWQAESRTSDPEFRFIPLLILPPRAALYALCDRRFAHMVEIGALEEVRALPRPANPENFPAMKILGVPELIAYLDGKISLAEAVNHARQMTRNYAKRQVTWFQNQWIGRPNAFRQPPIVINAFYTSQIFGQILGQIR